MFGNQLVGVTGVSATPTDVAKREPELSRALSRQATVITELESVCEILNSRLSVVLRPDGPSSAEKPNDRVGVVVVRAVDENTDRIHRLGVILSNIIDRIEI